jgi:hypothetical protein
MKSITNHTLRAAVKNCKHVLLFYNICDDSAVDSADDMPELNKLWDVGEFVDVGFIHGITAKKKRRPCERPRL